MSFWCNLLLAGSWVVLVTSADKCYICASLSFWCNLLLAGSWAVLVTSADKSYICASLSFWCNLVTNGVYIKFNISDVGQDYQLENKHRWRQKQSFNYKSSIRINHKLYFRHIYWSFLLLDLLKINMDKTRLWKCVFDTSL